MIDEEKYKILKNNTLLEIVKTENENFTIKELRDLFEKMIADGKGNYEIHHEAFCCGTGTITISDESKGISLD